MARKKRAPVRREPSSVPRIIVAVQRADAKRPVPRLFPRWVVWIDDEKVGLWSTQIGAWKAARAVAKSLHLHGLNTQARLYSRSHRIVTEHTYGDDPERHPG